MDSTDETSSVLLLERSRPLIGSRPPDPEEVPPSSELDDCVSPVLPQGVTPTPVVTSGGDFHGPLLGVLAAASILVGYRWIGVIPVSNTGASSVVFGRAGALVFALLALWLAWAAGRAKVTASGDSGGHRSRAAWLLTLAATVATVLAAALILRDIAVLRYTFGVSELLLASVAGTVLLVDERRRRRAGLPPASPSRPGQNGAAAT